MRRIGRGLSLAAMTAAALASGASVTTFAPNAPPPAEASVVSPAAPTAPTQAPAVSLTRAQYNDMVMMHAIRQDGAKKRSIWNGVEKRGNRRGRARFSYNR